MDPVDGRHAEEFAGAAETEEQADNVKVEIADASQETAAEQRQNRAAGRQKEALTADSPQIQHLLRKLPEYVRKWPGEIEVIVQAGIKDVTQPGDTNVRRENLGACFFSLMRNDPEAQAARIGNRRHSQAEIHVRCALAAEWLSEQMQNTRPNCEGCAGVTHVMKLLELLDRSIEGEPSYGTD